ncbi:MAG: peptidylprolyl isomerase [Oscillospiraceae bacterium]|nr:peptidylprolyl isomerase [Oscillospiraceae bacterium]
MTATITMEDGSKIVLALYPEKAPNTVQNFVDLCNQKFYDGLIFHRVLQGFMIQTGDKTGSGRGDNGWTIKGEFKDNGYTDNDLSYDAGVVGMARINEQNDTASSQFFITDTGNNKSALDGKYAAFAKVIEGMDVVRKISAVVVGKNPEIANDEENASPVEKQIIKTITVDTKGVNVPAPERITAAQ